MAMNVHASSLEYINKALSSVQGMKVISLFQFPRVLWREACFNVVPHLICRFFSWMLKPQPWLPW